MSFFQKVSVYSSNNSMDSHKPCFEPLLNKQHMSNTRHYKDLVRKNIITYSSSNPYDVTEQRLSSLRHWMMHSSFYDTKVVVEHLDDNKDTIRINDIVDVIYSKPFMCFALELRDRDQLHLAKSFTIYM